jgi:hypothetical protein
MKAIKRGLTLVGLLLAFAVGGLRALAQLVTTTVQDTVYRADGTPAGGSVVVTWNAFTTVGGVAVAAGSTSATIGAGGALSIALAPNAGSVPMGTYYTVVFHLNDGTTTRQYWSVPVTVPGGAPVKLAAVSTSVLPASVAMQTVSKAYVDSAIIAAANGLPLDASPYVEKAGDTMTGPLNLPADPVNPNQAADMHYVDSSVAALSGGIGGKVSLVPGVTQVVAQPAGSQLEVNNLNGNLYATQYYQAPGNNGVTNALASADCASGCEVQVERTYPGTELINPNELPQYTHVVDARGGTQAHTTMDPLPVGNGGASSAILVSNTSTRSAAQVAALLENTSLTSFVSQLTNNALTGGSNSFPENLGSGIPYFKSTFGVEQLTGNYNTQGQHVQLQNEVNCFGVGDCLAGSQFIRSDGGFRDSADEGTHPWDLNVAEDTVAFTGTCTSGCTSGSMQLSVSATAGGGTQGDGRFLIDKNPSKVISAGSVTGGTTDFLPIAYFSGTSFPVSVFVELAAPAVAQPNNMAPGTVTLPITTSGMPSGFATNTAVLPASGVGCLTETTSGIPNFEMVSYSVVDGTHVQLTLNRPHGSATAMAVGGLCGYGLEQTVDTVGAIRQLFPVLGSTSATSLYYAGAVSNVVGVKNETSAFLNDTFGIASISRIGNVVTVTATADFADDVNGLSMTVSGVADSSYNGTYTVTTTGPNTLTYANTGANSTSSGGMVGILTGGYALYPMAEVLSVYDTATKMVDGALTLGANTVAWASGDAVEEPHFYLQRTDADVEIITQYVPRPISGQSAGKTYSGKVANFLKGWEIYNSDSATDYLGSGGTLTPPTDAYSVLGVWQNDLEVQAGQNAIVRAHCNAHGCNRWDSGYGLFQMDSATGLDEMAFLPQSDTIETALDGTVYTFSPTAFTAPTINAGTLNATTIAGKITNPSLTTPGVVTNTSSGVEGTKPLAGSGAAVPTGPAASTSNDLVLYTGTSGQQADSSLAAVAIGPPGGLSTYLVTPGAVQPSYFGTVVDKQALMGSNCYFNGTNVVYANNGFCSWLRLNSAGVTGTSGFELSLAPAGTAGSTAPNLDTTNIAIVALPTSGGTPQVAIDPGVGFAPGTNAALTVNSQRTTDNAATVQITTAAAGDKGLVLQGTSGQTSSLLEAQSSGGAVLFSVSAAGVTSTAQVVASGSAPTMAAGAAAGTAPSCTSVTGANMAGVIACTVGTGTSASATLATVTFRGAAVTAPQGCSLMPRNAAAASATGTIYTTAPTTTGWTIAVGATALSASTAYSWSYSCM